jgi:hypothetical protein
MASQVRPGSTQPAFPQGLQPSVQLIGRRPAYSIRARGLEPQTEAGCMAAISSCDPEAQKTFGKRGRPCMEEGQVPHPENPCPHRQRQNRLPAQGHERHQQEPRDGVYRGPAGEESMQVGRGNCGESGPKRSGQGRFRTSPFSTKAGSSSGANWNTSSNGPVELSSRYPLNTPVNDVHFVAV